MAIVLALVLATALAAVGIVGLCFESSEFATRSFAALTATGVLSLFVLFIIPELTA